LALCQFRIREVISDKISTLMFTSLLNKHPKFGAKIFRRYPGITFIVLGRFLPHPLQGNNNNNNNNNQICKAPYAKLQRR